MVQDEIRFGIKAGYFISSIIVIDEGCIFRLGYLLNTGVVDEIPNTVFVLLDGIGIVSDVKSLQSVVFILITDALCCTVSIAHIRSRCTTGIVRFFVKKCFREFFGCDSDVPAKKAVITGGFLFSGKVHIEFCIRESIGSVRIRPCKPELVNIGNTVFVRIDTVDGIPIILFDCYGDGFCLKRKPVFICQDCCKVCIDTPVRRDLKLFLRYV